MSKWSEEDKQLVVEFSNQGMGLDEIAAEMEITRQEVSYLRARTKYSSLNSYKDLYNGTIEEVQQRLIKIMQGATKVTYTYFNSKDSGTPAATTYRKYFGSWENALEAAGVSSVSALKEDRSTTVYLVEFEGFYKVGITQQTVHQRLGGRYPMYEIVMQIECSLKEAKEIETTWLKNVKHLQYIPPTFPVEGRGFTECFKI